MCNEVVNTRLVKGVCLKCYQRSRADAKKVVYDLPGYGEVKYAPDGTVICHICGKSYKSLLVHVFQRHGLTEREYKHEFGLINKRGLIAESTKEKLQKAVELNYEVVVAKNLIEQGVSTRYKHYENLGKSRRVSEQERIALIQRAKDSGYKNILNKHKRGE